MHCDVMVRSCVVVWCVVTCGVGRGSGDVIGLEGLGLVWRWGWSLDSGWGWDGLTMTVTATYTPPPKTEVIRRGGCDGRDGVDFDEVTLDGTCEVGRGGTVCGGVGLGRAEYISMKREWTGRCVVRPDGGGWSGWNGTLFALSCNSYMTASTP